MDGGMNVAPHIIGGGYGGYGNGYGFGGGGFGAGLLGGIFGGLLFNRDGFGRDGRGFGHGGDGMCKTDIILDNQNANSIKAEIGGKFEGLNTRFNAFELAQCAANGAINMNIAETKFSGALNTKDIIHDLDTKICMTNRNIDQTKFELSKQMSDCCCKQEMLTIASTQRILDQLCADEKAELRDRLFRAERENDLFRTANIVATSVKATTVGSNFNTGTQSSSNNSGQIN